MQLQIEVLTAFLQSDELRALSEDTVLYTVAKRVEHMQQIRPRLEAAVIQEAQQQLMSAVRMPQLTPSALAFVAPNLPWVSQKQCNIASLMKHCRLSEQARAAYGAPAHWLLGQRNKSPKASHTMQFSVGLAEFKERCELLLRSEDGASRQISAYATNGSSFGGRDWHCRWDLNRVEGGLRTRAFLKPGFPCMPGGVKDMAWLPTGVKVQVGSFVKDMAATEYANIGKTKTMFVVKPNTDARAAPAWTEGDRVVAQVTMLAQNCL